MKSHPNAAVSLVSGSGLGTLLAWALGRAGVDLSVEEAAALAGLVSAVALFVGRNGVVGTWRFVRRRVLYGSR